MWFETGLSLLLPIPLQHISIFTQGHSRASFLCGRSLSQCVLPPARPSQDLSSLDSTIQSRDQGWAVCASPGKGLGPKLRSLNKLCWTKYQLHQLLQGVGGRLHTEPLAPSPSDLNISYPVDHRFSVCTWSPQTWPRLLGLFPSLSLIFLDSSSLCPRSSPAPKISFYWRNPKQLLKRKKSFLGQWLWHRPHWGPIRIPWERTPWPNQHSSCQASDCEGLMTSLLLTLLMDPISCHHSAPTWGYIHNPLGV